MAKTVYDFQARSLDRKEISLGEYSGKVLLIVNVASQCGFTPQYEGLEKLQKDLGPKGFTVLGFPCNQFGGQEPGSEEEIGAFCRLTYQASFPLFAKVEVNGRQAHPLFRFLKQECRGIFRTKAIKWNFTKFLVDREGRPVRRFPPGRKPEEIRPGIEELLV